jgi:uroporphyrinogen-III synthase
LKRVIVTRALREAQVWVRDLNAAGLDAVALPLIEIRPVADGGALKQAWQQLTQYAAVMFVSANAVDGFFAAGSAADFKTRAWATGPGTLAALQRAGVSTELIDVPAADSAQFDSEALWNLVGSTVRAAQHYLIVRGTTRADGSAAKGEGREWLAQRLRQAGADVAWLASYQRLCPVLTAAQGALAKSAAADASIWLFSSSQAVSNLKQALPQQNWSRARALATHERIAAAARRAGFGQVLETRPMLADVVASIESLK